MEADSHRQEKVNTCLGINNRVLGPYFFKATLQLIYALAVIFTAAFWHPRSKMFEQNFSK